MENFTINVQVRWSDFDPNYHLRHSVYYDWGALCRIEFFNTVGFTTDIMQQHKLGPVILREECVFRKEIKSGDKITINFKALKAKKDFSRITLQHEIKKNGDMLSAVLTIDFAWMDTIRRKLTSLPGEIQQLLQKFPKAENFQWLD
jgi:acyl-CoA thioester hydrolase